jgi:hypothetical protein
VLSQHEFFFFQVLDCSHFPQQFSLLPPFLRCAIQSRSVRAERKKGREVPCTGIAAFIHLSYHLRVCRACKQATKDIRLCFSIASFCGRIKAILLKLLSLDAASVCTRVAKLITLTTSPSTSLSPSSLAPTHFYILVHRVRGSERATQKQVNENLLKTKAKYGLPL